MISLSSDFDIRILVREPRFSDRMMRHCPASLSGRFGLRKPVKRLKRPYFEPKRHALPSLIFLPGPRAQVARPSPISAVL
jgi:hypothetical protein